MKAPAPIVWNAEDRQTLPLPGMEKFLKELSAYVVDARSAHAAARVKGWRVAREVFDYANRKEVQDAIYQLNHIDGKRRPGRPKTAHGLVMDALSYTGEFASKKKDTPRLISRRTLEGWLYQWYRPGTNDEPETGISVLMKLAPACAVSEFTAKIMKPASSPAFVEELVARLDEVRAAHGINQTEELPPEEWARKAVESLRKQFHQNGTQRMQSRARARALADLLNDLLDPYGFAVGPKAKS